MAPKVIINYQSDNLRYTTQELNNYKLYTWQTHVSDFLDKLLPTVPDKIPNFIISTDDRKELANQLREIISTHKIDYIFPLY